MAKIENPEIDYSSGDDEVDDDNFVRYSKRPDWTDVKPVAQNDGPHSVVVIRYNEVFEETFNYFRAILAANEISERALQLTSDCINLNASNYTLWHYRRVLLEKLNKCLLTELEYIENMISKNHKNYQVWEHYKFILNCLKKRIDANATTDISLEELTARVKRFIHSVLAEDSKNYHAWQHIQWLILDWAQWHGELTYIDKLIEEDIRNNSAWNHRYYVIQHTTGFTEQVIQLEVEKTIQSIIKAPNNESAWNYLLGIMRKSSKSLDSFNIVTETCENLSQNKETCSSHVLSFMVTYLTEQLPEFQQTKPEQFKATFSKATELCEKLANEIDTLRVEYWKYQAKSLLEKYPNV